MKIHYDRVADAMYMHLNKGEIHKTVKLNDRLVADLNKKGFVLGIEILDATSQLSRGSMKMLNRRTGRGIPVELGSISSVA